MADEDTGAGSTSVRSPLDPFEEKKLNRHQKRKEIWACCSSVPSLPDVPFFSTSGVVLGENGSYWTSERELYRKRRKKPR